MKYNACLSPNTTKLLTRTTIHRYVIKETSELTYPESVSRRVVCIEEIYHPFTIELDIGGRRYISYGYDKDDRKEKKGARDSRHTTGVYTINAGSEILPPLYIFDSYYIYLSTINKLINTYLIIY